MYILSRGAAELLRGEEVIEKAEARYTSIIGFIDGKGPICQDGAVFGEYSSISKNPAALWMQRIEWSPDGHQRGLMGIVSECCHTMSYPNPHCVGKHRS